jgi:bifunctional DNase/RNase
VQSGSSGRYVEARVVQVGFIDDKGLEGALTLESKEGRKFSMRSFSGEVALHMSRFIRGDRSSLPSIYNVVEELAEHLGIHLEKVEVYMSGSALRGDMYFTGKKDSLILDGYRASDAIALALFYDAHIMVEDAMLEPNDSLYST